jgi:hypothetical protein
VRRKCFGDRVSGESTIALSLMIHIEKEGFENGKAENVEILITGAANMTPVPRGSLMIEIAASASVKPRPMPSPSMIDAPGPFLDAKASARARMMQLTTISGTKTPRT